jgi:hypothetical protein
LLHQTETTNKMKTTTTIILATLLSLSINVLFASNDGAILNNDLNATSIALAPSTPAEATFDEMNEAVVMNLAPVTPAEADFTESVSETTFDISALAPVTPGEAGFASEEDPSVDASALAPVTPPVADFSEGI